MKNYFFTLCLAVMALFAACTSESAIEESVAVQDNNVCRMVFESPKPDFDGTETRAKEAWKDGEVVYFVFQTNGGNVGGKATYVSSGNCWTLEYNGQLSSTSSAACKAYYFDGNYSDGGSNVSITPTTAIFTDANATYSKDEDGVIVRANLTPMTGRIRFTGDSGKKFSVTGVNSYVKYKKSDGTFESSSTAVETSINSNGSSPYLYLFFGNDRTLGISYDKCSFEMNCNHPILDAGKSGYMKLPTQDSHSGWAVTETTVPVTSGLYAFFPFDGDIENKTAYEMTTFGNDYSFVESYDGSKALSLQAKENSFIQINNPLVDDQNTSVSFWAKDLGEGHIYHVVNTGNTSSFLFCVMNNWLTYHITNYDMRYKYGTSFTHESLEGWHMITMTCQLKSSTMTKTLYIDGVLKDIVTDGNCGSSSHYRNGLKFIIGGSVEAEYGYVYAANSLIIDNFRVYNNRVITADEVKQIYNSEKK